MFNLERFWAGTEEAHSAYLAETKHALTLKQPQAGSGFEEHQGAPRLYSRQGSIGVISVHGNLVNSDSWVNEYLGRSGYSEIRDALIHAATDPDVKAIVLDIKSGGGAVSGVSDTADLISRIDTKVKPVHAFSDAIAASAAYWLGCSARSLDVGNTAEIGSIGVLVVHQENSRMLVDEGITTTVIRSGKYKALGLSAEALSDAGKEAIQSQVDQLSAMFSEHVASSRGTTSAALDARAGQGRMFIGQGAVDVGLADSITSFDALMSRLQGGIDSKNQPPKYGANLQKGSPLKTALTEQEIAAMAAGGISAELPVAAIDPAAIDPAAPRTKASAELEAPTAAPVNAEVLTLMHTQLADANGKVIQLSIELAGVKAASEAAMANVALMRPVLQASVGNLRVALRQSKAGVDALTDGALLAEHASLSQAFTNEFKVGGVAAPSSGSSEKVVEFDNPSRMARINATRINRK